MDNENEFVMNLGDDDDDDDDNESVISSVSKTSNSSRKNYPAILTSCFDFDVAHLNEKANQVLKIK
jgi:hypothetical protein